jgi:type I restriction enzyme S subunit
MPVEVPKGWREVRVGHIANEASNRNRIGEDLPVLSMTKHRGFVRSNDYFSRSVYSENTENYKIVRRGQFAYATIHLDEGSIDYLRNFDAGLISPMYSVFDIDPLQIDADIAFRSFKRFALSGRFDPYSNGGVNRRKSILFKDLSAFKFALPPMPEQRAISEVLRAAQTAIEKMESLIQASDRATRALLQSFFFEHQKSLKWSCIGKLGHWKSGGTPATAVEANWNGPFPWVCPKDIKGPTVASTIDQISQQAAEALGIVEPGTLLVVVRGMILARAVPTTICEVHCAFNQDVKAFVPKPGVSAGFLKLWLDINETKLLAEVETATHGTKRFPLSKLNNFPVPELSGDTQERLVSLAESNHARLRTERAELAARRATYFALSQELLSGRLRLPDSMIARHGDNPGQAA